MRRLMVAIIVLFFIQYPPLSAEEAETVWSNKSWTVTFNTAMDFSNGTEAIYVMGEKGDDRVPIQVHPSQDEKSVEIVGQTPWSFEPGATYTIYITTDLTSKQGKPLEDTVTKTFHVHEQADQIIQMNDIVVSESTKADVVEEFGEPVTEEQLSGEYYWESYRDGNFENFVLVLYDSTDVVHGYYTNQDLFELSGEHRLDAKFKELKETYEERAYIIKDDDQRPEQFLLGQEDVTLYLFLDVYRDSCLSSVLVMSREAEEMYFKKTSTLEDVSQMQIFEITNAFRANYGMDPLERKSEIDRVARKHSVDMAENEYFNHVNLEGEGVLQRFQNAEVPYQSSGENISAGYATGIEAMEGWINSSGHRKNLLAPHELIGIGVVVEPGSPYGIYYTQDFANK
ncbi:CAP domain-containing protein [Halobacillus litoralis]|uniref:CAP domain-containing protein n=1 Tax=Halobacillus litoralis TaxID=45668 RepID=UPI001CD1C66B|nr:CAP domain-containing protein [Halobacillus litoralis]MCA0971484.1 CAP domain-containing protein [Halobacillus litoralis]